MATLQFKEGDIIAGKYRVERCLGEGGMGAVLAARHLTLGQRVAIKVMHPELAANEQSVQRFTREGQAAARLQSAHVTRVLDVGQLDSGAPYLVMEYLEGKDLAAVLQERGPLPLAEVAGYLLQAGEALIEAHAAGIVHRDLKPANLFLTSDPYGQPCVKVLDFGISKLSSDPALAPGSAVAMTATSVVMGSPLYMPPEQMRSTRDADARSDVWALGVILYELLTAQPAWTGETLSEVCVRVATDPTPSARSSRAELPPEIDAIITRCLEKEPNQRYQKISDFVIALAPFAGPEHQMILRRLKGVPREAAPAVAELSGASQTKNAAASSGASTSGKTGVAAPEAGGTGVAWGSQTHATQTGRSRALKWSSAAVLVATVITIGMYWKVTRTPTPAVPSTSAAVQGSVTAGPAPEIAASTPAALASVAAAASPSSTQEPKLVESAPVASAAPAQSAEPVRQRVPAVRTVGKPTRSQNTKSTTVANPTVAAPDWGGRE